MAGFRANGKLLITGEYLVLDAAPALALPLKLGQTLDVAPGSPGRIIWEARHTEGQWFRASYHSDSLNLTEVVPAAAEEAYRLGQVLKALKKLSPDVFADGLSFTTSMEFHPSWGFGSSSTLISLLSQWAMVDAYALLEDTFNGSGYDVACASAKGPIIYQLTDKPTSRPVTLSPVFRETMLIYSGIKQDSREAMKAYRLRKHDPATIKEVGDLAVAFAGADSLGTLMQLMDRHEKVLGRVLGMPTLKEQRFSGFDGQVKSLGAWGGDFFLAASSQGIDYMTDFFLKNGYALQFRLADIGLGLNSGSRTEGL